jgi:hypothetical protein
LGRFGAGGVACGYGAAEHIKDADKKSGSDKRGYFAFRRSHRFLLLFFLSLFLIFKVLGLVLLTRLNTKSRNQLYSNKNPATLIPLGIESLLGLRYSQPFPFCGCF